MGDSDKVVGHYEDFCNNKKSYNTIRDDLPEELERPSRKRTARPKADQFTLKDSDGKVLDELEALSDVTLEMEVEVLNDVDQATFGTRSRPRNLWPRFSPPTSKAWKALEAIASLFRWWWYLAGRRVLCAVRTGR